MRCRLTGYGVVPHKLKFQLVWVSSLNQWVACTHHVRCDRWVFIVIAAAAVVRAGQCVAPYAPTPLPTAAGGTQLLGGGSRGVVGELHWGMGRAR